jgi:hypothetical protein
MGHIEKIARQFWPLGIVLAIVFAVYIPALSVGYFADDFDFAVRMPRAPFRQMLTHSTDGTIGGGSWRPAVMVSYWLTMAGGQGAAFNHTVSLVIYLALLGVFYVCVHELFPERSRLFVAATTLVVGLMPNHAEPVVWVAARADLIAALLGLAALYAWLRGFGWIAAGLLALSLGAKEFWILFAIPLFFLAPSKFSARERVKFFVAYLALALAWFVARFYITRFGVGGYSITAEQQVLGIQHLANEVIAFSVGAWNFGTFQSWIIRFAQHYWFITSWIIGAGIATLGFFSWQTPRARFLFASIICLQLPTLALAVPFIRPGASVGEQRYWFAGSIFLVLLAAHFLKKQATSITIGVTILFILGITSNIRHFSDAAEYRNLVLSGWKTLDKTDVAQTKVAFLPDSWYGVHLLASPFFEAALENENLPKPRSVSTWYQQCNVQCLTPASAQQGLHGLVRLLAQDPRIFSNTSHGLRYDATEQLEPGTNLVIWSGTSWIKFSSESGEN